jgi:hypothetical protein
MIGQSGIGTESQLKILPLIGRLCWVGFLAEEEILYIRLQLKKLVRSSNTYTITTPLSSSRFAQSQKENIDKSDTLQRRSHLLFNLDFDTS